jgi:cell division GTPase FtsZ
MMSPIKLPEFGSDFRKKGTDIQKGIRAMDEAISELSMKCNPAEARRALYLVSGPPKEMSIDMIKEIGDYMRDIAPEAIIRNGDYPRNNNVVDVTIIFSELSDVDRVRDYYTRSASLIPETRRRQEETDAKLKALEDISKDIPSLLQ